MKKRTLEIIFTRDFNLWVNEISTDQYNNEFAKVWGKSINQVITYDGRSSQWCRFPDELVKLKNYMVKKPLDSAYFLQSEHLKFRQDNLKLRKLLKKPIKGIKDPVSHLKEITELFSKDFYYNALGVFLPGSWKNDFLSFHHKHKAMAHKVVDRALKTRRVCEGIHKEVGDYFRKWLGPKLEKQRYPYNFVKLLSVSEVKNFITKGELPPLKILERRVKGFIYMDGKLHVAANLKAFFTKRGIELVEPKFDAKVREFSGVVASRGKVVKGRVKIALNSDEIKFFKKGQILVTSMTSPDYLPAMKKAAAIITDEGGITSHAAIVSRELGVPCIINTKIATKVLKDGDMVEVDANKGIVKKLPLK